MHVLINNVVTKDDRTGQIRIKVSRRINERGIDDFEKGILIYLDHVMALNLNGSNNKEDEIAEHVTDQQRIYIIIEAVEYISNMRIRARLYDILQLHKKRKFENAQLAMQAYWNIATEAPSLSAKREYLLRIINILKGLGKGNQMLASHYVANIVQLIENGNIHDECFTICTLAEEVLVFQLSGEQHELLVKKIVSGSDVCLAAHDYERYRKVHEALSVLLPDDGRYHTLEAARGYVKQADHFALTPNASQHRIASLYKKALLRFKFLEEKSAEVAELELKLLAANAAAAKQIQMIGSIEPPIFIAAPEFELPEIHHCYEGVDWLISLPLLSKTQTLHGINSRPKTFLDEHFGKSVMTNGKGQTIGISDPKEVELFQDAKTYRRRLSGFYIMKKYAHFSEQQVISEIEVAEMIVGSKFVPEDRIGVYARGLYHGFRANFLEAVHILVPQLENSLRYLLVGFGKNTVKLAEELEKELSLQSVLVYLREFLHEDLVFELQGLLNEAFGENLRNNLAHGLSNPRDFNQGYIGIYTWWFSLKLVLDIESFILSSDIVPSSIADS